MIFKVSRKKSKHKIRFFPIVKNAVHILMRFVLYDSIKLRNKSRLKSNVLHYIFEFIRYIHMYVCVCVNNWHTFYMNMMIRLTIAAEGIVFLSFLNYS